MDAASNYYVWLVAYVDSTTLHLVKPQLEKYLEYAEVEAYIPTIRVLKKEFKGKEQFEEVPLLFNYGFFKIPRKLAIHKNFLDDMQKNLSCIFAWVRDGAKIVNRGGENVSAALASSEEIAELIRSTINIGTHTAEELGLLKPGSWIILRGYPWEGSEAIFLGIDEKRKKVRVKLILFDTYKEVEVSYDNVFFTMYSDKRFDDTLNKNVESLDEMAERKSIDRILHKNSNYGRD